jgi:hypothetical protein
MSAGGDDSYHAIALLAARYEQLLADRRQPPTPMPKSGRIRRDPRPRGLLVTE